MALDPHLALADAIAPWTPDHTYEPRWSDDRAAEFLSRWRTVAESLVTPGKQQS